jgi:hypothetical protein
MAAAAIDRAAVFVGGAVDRPAVDRPPPRRYGPRAAAAIAPPDGA